MFIAKDFDQFKSCFVTQLRTMLSDDELGAFILVLANSLQDESIKRELNDDLENSFRSLKENFSSVSKISTADDVAVFRQLQNIELNDLPVWKNKTIGCWDISFNSLRKLRPARASSQSFESIVQGFDENKFHFNKPFLKPEILWAGEHKDNKLRVLYNKFPFSDYHLLIAVSPEQNCSQLLTQNTHQLIFALTRKSAQLFPGFGVGFNSLAAGASINHLHFQGFIREQGFPIEADRWRHNGGLEVYPLNVSHFVDADASWRYIDQLIKQNAAFNCLYRQNACYVIPRKYQGTVQLPDWLEGAGWLDVAGVMTVSDEEIFDSLDEESVTQSLELLL